MRFHFILYSPGEFPPDSIVIEIEHTKSWDVETEAPVMGANERPDREDVWGSENGHTKLTSAKRVLSGGKFAPIYDEHMDLLSSRS